jgi:anti-anti-sigma regulatory factor
MTEKMDQKTIQNILSKPFALDDWQDILRETFGVKKLLQKPSEISLPKNDKARAAYELGSFNTADDRSIGLYWVKLKPEVWLERNRVGLRGLLRNVYRYDVDGALIAFEQDDKWRLSFVSEIRTLDDKGKPTEQVTEPKRYTYLLGKDEKTKTPVDRLVGIAGKKLSLEDIKEAFSVETLNEEFFKVVARHFYQLVGATEGKGAKAIPHKRVLKLPIGTPNDATKKIYQEFAVRLIGRTIFCWFLKMKKSKTGKSLLPEHLLSSKAVKENENYYHFVLEKLFFQTLNTPMDKRIKNLPKGCDQIPFLNGGLFEPQTEDYYHPDKTIGISSHVNDLKIPDGWFYDFFTNLEQYNFTIDENNVVDVDVSVDPEMLGRIFENLLAEIDPDSGESARNATGSFYTPREIVDYMATESLTSHIFTQLQSKNKTLTIKQNDVKALFKLDEVISENTGIAKYKSEILDAIDRLKILDPACGSCAFPMGILQKLVMALQKLDPNAVLWKNKQLEKIDNAVLRKIVKQKLEQTTVEYARKIGIIQNSLYGVDIQPIAAEISKLRCFLTLIVDGNIDDSKPNRGIEPLPNLEFKFVTADTLLQLPQEEDSGGLFHSNDGLDKLQKIRLEYLQSFGKEKDELKERFLKIQKDIFKQQLGYGAGMKPGNKALKISEWNPFGHDKTYWFDAEWMFGLTDGFDIVIGNPPYIQLQKSGGELSKRYGPKEEGKGRTKKITPSLYQTFDSMGDIYCLFYERGYQLLKPQGRLCFITSNKWMRAGYGENTRNFFAENTNPELLIDFAGVKVFESATVDTNILMFSKVKNRQKTSACVVKREGIKDLNEFIIHNSTPCNFKNGESWVILSPIEQRIKAKIEAVGTPLKDWDISIYRGVLTGCNEAFIIDGAKKKELIRQDPKNDDIIRPILRGRDIKRYGYNFDEDSYLIATFPSRKIDINAYPAVKDWLINGDWVIKPTKAAPNGSRIGSGKIRLEQTGAEHSGFRSRKKNNGKWFETQDSIAYWEDFSRQKIVYGQFRRGEFAFDENQCFLSSNEYFITSKKVNLKILLALLNSKICYFYGTTMMNNLGGATTIAQKDIFVKTPLPKNLDKQTEQQIERLVREKNYQKLDKIIYALYGLDKEELEFIEKL